MNQTRKQTINNKQLNEKFTSAVNKIKYLQNQLIHAYKSSNNKGQSQTIMSDLLKNDETNSIKKRYLFI